MGDLIYVVSVIAVGIAVIAFIIFMAKKHLDAISAETFSADVDMQADEALGEVSAKKEGDPADVLFESPHYDRYEALFNYIWSACHGRDGSQYKIDLLLQSLDMGHTLEADGFYVTKSIEKDLLYFCETEHEFEMFFKSPASVLRGSVKGILDMISFYIYTCQRHFKMSIFAEMGCRFLQGSIQVLYSLIHHITCWLEARQALIYQLVLGLTGKTGKYNYSKAVHLYPPFFDIFCSAKNYKTASALTYGEESIKTGILETVFIKNGP